MVGADSVPKKLGSGEINIPKIYLYSYVSMRAGTSAHVPGNLGVISKFKIECESYNYLSIGYCSHSISVTGQKADGTTETKTYSSVMDISNYVSIEISPSRDISFVSGYVQSYSTDITISLDNISIY